MISMIPSTLQKCYWKSEVLITQNAKFSKMLHGGVTDVFATHTAVEKGVIMISKITCKTTCYVH